jgi:hypothetical protein
MTFMTFMTLHIHHNEWVKVRLPAPIFKGGVRASLLPTAFCLLPTLPHSHTPHSNTAFSLLTARTNNLYA